MQYSEVTAQMRRRAEGLLGGRLDDLTGDYVFPLAVDLMETRLIVSTSEEVCALLMLQRTALVERGVIELHPEVTAVDLPRRGRMRVWVDWHERTAFPEGARVSSVVYYCSVTEAGLKFEMIDYLRLSTPELETQLAAVALTA